MVNQKLDPYHTAQRGSDTVTAQGTFVCWFYLQPTHTKTRETVRKKENNSTVHKLATQIVRAIWSVLPHLTSGLQPSVTATLLGAQSASSRVNVPWISPCTPPVNTDCHSNLSLTKEVALCALANLNLSASEPLNAKQLHFPLENRISKCGKKRAPE